jgi:hypothetical protein
MLCVLNKTGGWIMARNTLTMPVDPVQYNLYAQSDVWVDNPTEPFRRRQHELLNEYGLYSWE